jgi:hypothetical protein
MRVEAKDGGSEAGHQLGDRRAFTDPAGQERRLEPPGIATATAVGRTRNTLRMDEAERASRALRGRIGAYRLHATHDTRETTKAARSAFWSSFERAVDPDGLLSPEERTRRADYARAAHFARLAYLSARARAARPQRRRGDEI